MNLKVTKDDRFVWISNVDNIAEVQLNLKKYINEMLEQSKSICKYDIKKQLQLSKCNFFQDNKND